MASKRLGYLRLYQHLDKIFLLFFTNFLILDYGWRPLNSWLAAQLLRLSGYQFLSYNNILPLIRTSPITFVCLVLLFGVNLFVAYFQIVYLFKGLYNLFSERAFHLKDFLLQSFQDTKGAVREFTASKILFISFYIAVLFPILGKLLNIYYLDKFIIPSFIQDFLLNNLWFAFLLMASGLFVFILSIRWMFALPQILFEGKGVREAIRFSRSKTHKRWWGYLWKIVFLFLKTILLYLFLIMLVMILQAVAESQADSRFPRLILLAGLFNFSLIKLAYYMMVSYFLIKFMGIVTEKALPPKPAKQHPLLRLTIVAVAGAFFSFEGYVSLFQSWDTKPLVISHRGVSNNNGVQNTIESLVETAKLKPDYVEIDIQETADGQFVLMHDANLEVLAGVDLTPQDLTLEELTNLDVTENGYTVKIPSFQAYLDKADELGQKLLVEVKTSSQDSKDMMTRFLTTYGKRLKEKNHQLQSLDYRVVATTIAYDQDLPVFFILPYNTIFPQTQATGYTMEYSTLDETFTSRMFDTGQQVYDWTINDEESISKSFQLGVDGMITDDVELVQVNVNEEFENPDIFYILLNRALNYINVFASA
ncbi:Glycerophosphoryl diester phosphodiesterase [Streptococcus sp. DD10]|uniref:glycerophosphoryl diester phosphodiesterase membrane domain-containing protein n=1 Tax=Streptococcus sp. DD10 TaxID=1777878 RepID=UPI0007946B85|nr:glycerophosphodiester phosphodiesterase [Streptococcus sp. DD10]KXT74395.1 Glycerophosphoryl diester phosphodiesterase [Streptococcus sp. DD10]